jgi:tRNA(fMet)-specific endonuclease VapC
MKYLLDANAVIGLIRLDKRLVSQVNRQRQGDFVTSSIVLHELYFGALKSQRLADNLKTLRDIDLATLDFDGRDAEVAAEVRIRLDARGTPIGPHDLLIAGQALSRDLTLITRNTREFARVEGLRVENRQDG